MLFCVQLAALRRADPPSKESYRLCKKDHDTEKAAKAQQNYIGPYVDIKLFLCLSNHFPMKTYGGVEV
jgi:hypothetical protein